MKSLLLISILLLSFVGTAHADEYPLDKLAKVSSTLELEQSLIINTGYYLKKNEGQIGICTISDVQVNSFLGGGVHNNLYKLTFTMQSPRGKWDIALNSYGYVEQVPNTEEASLTINLSAEDAYAATKVNLLNNKILK